MPLNRDFIGRTYAAPDTYEVGREHIREFAASIGDDNELYTDVAAARAAGYRDVVAPPTFLTVLGFRFRAASPMADPELGLEYSRVVHGAQSFQLHRPVCAGDRLSCVQQVTDIKDAGRNEVMTTVLEVVDEHAQPVATLTSTLVSRGTAAARKD